MEKLALKGKQFAGFCLLILFSILINYGGSLFATINKLPVWLDSAGTAVAAYLGKLLSSARSRFYCVVGAAIGIIFAFAVNR